MFFCVFCSNESLIRYLAIPRTSGKLHFKRQRELTLAKKKEVGIAESGVADPVPLLFHCCRLVFALVARSPSPSAFRYIASLLIPFHQIREIRRPKRAKPRPVRPIRIGFLSSGAIKPS